MSKEHQHTIILQYRKTDQKAQESSVSRTGDSMPHLMANS